MAGQMNNIPILPKRILGERVSLRRIATGEVTVYEIRQRGKRGAIGEVALELTAREGIIQRLCINEANRGYGAGSGTAAALLRSLARHYSTVRTWAPPDRGLAVYFWMRMGFNPIPGDGPKGGLWFKQALRPQDTRQRAGQRG